MQLLSDVLESTPAVGGPARPDVRAGIVAGARLTRGLAPEWREIRLDPSSWARDIGGDRVDLVLLEFADGSVPGWGPPNEPELIALGRWCAETGVPLVVWVTASEKPFVAEPSVVDAASVIYVATPGTASAWRERWPNHVVEVLLPAAQPRLHNPTAGGCGERRESAAVVLAESSAVGADMLADVVTAALRPMPRDAVDIWQVGPDQATLPAELRSRLVGSVRYEAAATVPARYRVLVDAGPGGGSAAWTVIEAAAAQTPSVTLTSRLTDLPMEVASLVPATDDPKALRQEIVARIAQPELRDRESLRLQRAVLDGHTYAHRVDTMLAGLGLALPSRDRSISAVVPTNRAHEIDNILDNVARQAYSDVQLVLVLHGLQLDRAELAARARAQGMNNVEIIEASADLTLGACLNRGIDVAGGAY
ncbi:MAG TPA: glycosyltransferase, partial [Jiangellaceae bacterium]|nr:glycosyltransferase [Jiangellaceae bacterium]